MEHAIRGEKETEEGWFGLGDKAEINPPWPSESRVGLVGWGALVPLGRTESRKEKPHV